MTCKPEVAHITRQAMKVLENNLIAMKFHNDAYAFPSQKPTTRWDRIRWAAAAYFSTLWSAICGRRRDY